MIKVRRLNVIFEERYVNAKKGICNSSLLILFVQRLRAVNYYFFEK